MSPDPRPWRISDLVKELQFTLSDTNGAFDAPDIKRNIETICFDSIPDTNIIEVDVDAAKIKISYNCTLGSNDRHFRADESFVSVEFRKARSIDELSDFLGRLNTFFAMAAGKEVSFSNFWISPSEDREQPLIGEGTTPVCFELYWPSRSKETSEGNKHHRSSCVLRCWNHSDRKIISNCLKFWFDAWPRWQRAFSGYLVASRAGSTFDGNRLVNACKWLESTPDESPANSISSDLLSAVSSAAKAKARELGLNIDARLDGAINQLKGESRNDLHKRLVNLVVQQDDPDLEARFLNDLSLAYRIRGSFAHRKFFHSNNMEFGEYVRATRAVEALAFLLLFGRLPLPDDQRPPVQPGDFAHYTVMPPTSY